MACMLILQIHLFLPPELYMYGLYVVYLKNYLTKGGSWAPQDPLSYAPEGKHNSLLCNIYQSFRLTRLTYEMSSDSLTVFCKFLSSKKEAGKNSSIWAIIASASVFKNILVY